MRFAPIMLLAFISFFFYRLCVFLSSQKNIFIEKYFISIAVILYFLQNTKDFVSSQIACTQREIERERERITYIYIRKGLKIS